MQSVDVGLLVYGKFSLFFERVGPFGGFKKSPCAVLILHG